MGGLRWPDRPFPVTCVLAEVSVCAAISQRFDPSECAGPRPMPAETNLVALGERLNANTIMFGNPGTTYLALANWRAAKSLDAF